MTPDQLARQPEHLPPPVETDLFELGERRTRLPGEPELAQARAHEVAEHRSRQTIGREVAVKTRILPMRAGRQDQRIEIAADGGEVLGFLRRRRGQCVAQCSGRGARHHGEFAARDALTIVRDPVDELVPGAAEFLGSHGGVRPHFLAKGAGPRTSSLAYVGASQRSGPFCWETVPDPFTASPATPPAPAAG